MLAILEHPAVRALAVPLSVEAYHALGAIGTIPEKTELLRGVVIRKMPKSPLHVFLTKWFFRQLAACLPAGLIVQKEDPITLGESEPEPDVSVVKGQETDFCHAHPTTAELVIEIAVTSEELDREKISVYAEGGVKEYWLVLANERKIEVYRDPRNGDYRGKEVFISGRITSESVADFAVELNDVFAGMA